MASRLASSSSPIKYHQVHICRCLREDALLPILTFRRGMNAHVTIRFLRFAIHPSSVVWGPFKEDVRMPILSTLHSSLSGQRAGEPFNENVAQVKRLISRDRKEFLGK